MADLTFLEILKEIREKLPSIIEASDLFDADIIDRLESLADLNLDEIMEDLKKGSYLGNRKTDINLALNMVGITEELIRLYPDEAEAIWTDGTKTVQYDKATVTFVDGVEIVIPFTFDGNPTTVSTHGDLQIQLGQNQAFLDKLEDTLISGFSASVTGEIIRLYDTTGKNSNIERITLNAISGEYREKNPVYFWLKTTSAFQTLAMRSGDIISLTSSLPKLQLLANSIEQVLEIQSKIPQFIDTFDANGNPNGDVTIFNNLTKLISIYSNLTALITVYNDIKAGGTNFINTVANGTYKAQIATLADATYKAKIESVYSNMTAIQNASANAQTATLKAQEATTKANQIMAIAGQQVANTLQAGSPCTVSYDSTTGKFTFNIPQGLQGAKGDSFTVNATGTLVQRSLYNNQPAGFAFLAYDTVVDGATIPHMYFKTSNSTGDYWSAGVPFGRGEKGDIGISIASLEFVSTTDASGVAAVSGATDTYKFLLSDGNYTNTFIVKNGMDSDVTSADLLLKIDIANIVDDLISTETNKPLSANQGRILKSLIDNLNTVIMSDDSNLDELQEIVNFIKLNRADLDALSISSIAGLSNALANKISIGGLKTVNGESLEGSGNLVIGSATDYQEFTTSGTWTKPTGINYVYVEVVGGGAGGSGGNGNYGGGGGGFTNKVLIANNVASTVTVTIGAGGLGSTSAYETKGGGDSSFGGYVIAKGGDDSTTGVASRAGGGEYAYIGSSGGTASPGGYSSGAGGYRSKGGNCVKGGAGGGAMYSGSYYAGGISQDGGNGGAGLNSATGGNGAEPGGGGGAGNTTGGSGAKGRVRVWCW